MADAYLREHKPVRSQYRSPRRAEVTTITLHTFEAPVGRTALAGAKFIQGRSTPGSYARLGDVHGNEIQLVRYSDEAFHDATGGNRFSIGISLMMYAADWPKLPAAERDALVETMASMAAHANEWVKANEGYEIPARRLTKGQSDRGVRGVIAHADRDPARRSDPGRHFPWLQFLNRFSQFQGGDPVATPSDEVREIQQYLVGRGVNIGAFGPNKDGVDGLLGNVTIEGIKHLGTQVDVRTAERDRLTKERDALEAAVTALETQLDDALATGGQVPADVLEAAQRWQQFTELVDAAGADQ